jgi:DNA-binding CsgD family transcriptional regulator
MNGISMAGDGTRLDAVSEHLHRVLTVAAGLIGDATLGTPRTWRDSDAARSSLKSADIAVRTWMLKHSEVRDHGRIVANELDVVRAELDAYDSARRHASMDALTRALRSLRTATTADEVATRIPHAVAELGFDRVLFSWFENRRWVPTSVHTINGPEEARALLSASPPPYRPVAALVEADMVRQRRPILVRDARGNPRVHRDLQEVMNSRSYVAAPVLTPAAVVGFLHADLNPGATTVDDVDRDVLSVVAEGVGLALERVSIIQELDVTRARLDRHTATLRSMMAELDGDDPEPVYGGPPACDTPRPAGPNDLTRREVEILGLVAAGHSNTVIAERLYVTPGTVKTHMKNLMRKLGAATRVEAVATYRRFGESSRRTGTQTLGA